MEIEGSSPLGGETYGDLTSEKDQELFDLDLKINDLAQQYQDKDKDKDKDKGCSLNSVTCSCLCTITSSCWCH